MHHKIFQLLLNCYPPYWGTGIVVEHVAPDYSEIRVRMKMKWYNRNYVKTHFGGSLYAMTDPFYMLMLIQILGKTHVVWDKSASIDFIKPGRGAVNARFQVDSTIIQDILAHTANGQKYLKDLTVAITDENGDNVATVVKTLYIRKQKPPAAESK